MVFDRILTRLSGLLLMVIFGLIVFHAPFSVYFGQFFPDVLAKSWKELLLVFAIPPIFVLAARKKWLGVFTKDTLLILISAYATIHLVMLLLFSGSLPQEMAGLAIDLRFLLFFVLVFILVSIVPQFRKNFIKVGAISALFSVIFAFAQVALLPHDILKYIGYSKTTIAPYLTVDQNPEYIRINGTLRGPNPLGVYVTTLLLMGLSFVLHIKKRTTYFNIAVIILSVLGIMVLWFTYSRSAIASLVIGCVVIAIARWGKYIKWQYAMAAVVFLVLIGGMLFISRDSHFVQNTLFHNNPAGGSERNSDDNHVSSLQDGLSRFIKQPLGAGVGSTGSASLYGDKSLVIENQYLFVAHEVGWICLGLFMVIVVLTMRRLYAYRRDWLALGAFASGIAWIVVGFIQPVLVDDTVSLVWWGIAAIALAGAGKGYYGKKPNKTTT